MLLLHMWTLLSLYYHVGFPCSLSEPHGGRFDADDAERRPVDGRAATRQPAALKKLLVLYARRTGGRPINKTQKTKTFESSPRASEQSVDLGVSAGVDLGPAVGGHEAQDLRHLLELVQTVDVDLGTRVCVCVERVVAFLSGSTCVCLCICVACVNTCVPSSSPRLVNRYSYPYAALQLSHTTW